jgi:uncharacterized protein
MTKQFTRRDFLRILKNILFSLFAGGSGSFVYALLGEPGWIDVEEVDIVLPQLSESFAGFRVLQISDIHMGGWMNRERLSHLVDLISRQKFDLIVMTGDYLLGHTWSENLDDAVDAFVPEVSRLTKDHLVLAILGNHDHWTDAGKVRAMLLHSGVVELNNDVYSLKRDGHELHIAGVDDVWERKDRLDDVHKKLPETGAAILLAHEPDFADTSSRKGRFALQLSGHSHGGQVVIPFYGAPVLPHLGEKYPSGLYRVGEMWQYTNRGVGMIDPAVRFNCRPEITVFTLKSA